MSRHSRFLFSFLALASMTFLAACGGDGGGLAEDEVRELVRSEVDLAVQEALSEEPVASSVPDSSGAMEGPGVSAAEAERIARGVLASVPPRSARAEYTKHVVAASIERYEQQGLDSVLAHHNRRESVDGQWYVFIIGEDGLVLAHHDPARVGLDLQDWVGTDANGYRFGPDIMSATEAGKWVSYVYRNPAIGGLRSGAFQLKNVWVVRHDGLFFASGWYIDADDFTRQLVEVAVDEFTQGGLDRTVQYFASPGSALAGLEAAIGYYNAADTVEGRWFAFIADPEGVLAAHSDPSLIGADMSEMLGGGQDLPSRPGRGSWVTGDSFRFYLAESQGYLFGSGWALGPESN